MSEIARNLEAEIAAWANETFGPATIAGTVSRANKEMAELLYAVATDQSHKVIMEEAADVFIILCRLKGLTRRSLISAIHEKMRVNKKRKWKLDGHGHGQHIPEK